MGRLIATLLVFAFLAGSAAGAESEAPTIDGVRSVLVGTWQSTDDTKFTREFDADGNSADRYEGDASATTIGRWTLFRGSDAPKNLAAAQKLEAGVFYLKLDENGDQLLFALAGLSRSDLKMVYLARGNLLSFIRLK